MWQARSNFVIGLWMALSGLNAGLQTSANLMLGACPFRRLRMTEAAYGAMNPSTYN
jgi:hypothetical protein